MIKTINTIFGRAVIGNMGYYVITSKSEGNYGKLLHRLIYEAYHNLKIPSGYEIHHLDENKLNNCILNLKMISKGEHRSLHSTGRHYPVSDETKRKISNALKGNKLSKATRNKLVDVHTRNFIESDKEINVATERPLSHLVNISKHQNTSGYFRVTKQKNNQCKQGFTWAYKYYDEQGKQQSITCTDLKKLKEKVLSKGLDWICYLNESEAV